MKPSLQLVIYLNIAVIMPCITNWESVVGNVFAWHAHLAYLKKANFYPKKTIPKEPQIL